MDARLYLNRPAGDEPQQHRSQAVVGAAPAVVSAGAPGAREEVRAYASRIAAAWEAFMKDDFARVFYDGTKHTPDQLSVMTQVRVDRSKFDLYRESLQSFSFFGPSASEAWQELILHETTLNNDRKLFADAFGKLKSPTPPALENEGGVPAKPLFSGPTIGTGLVAAAAAVVVVGGLLIARSA